MDDVGSELAHLHEELRKTEVAFWKEFDRTVARWDLRIGPLRFTTPVTPKMLALIYLLFNALCFVAGAVFAVFGGVWAALGVALIVGSLFSYGAFVGQSWVIVRQRAIGIFDRVVGDTTYAELERLAGVHRGLLDQIESLNDPRSAHKVTENSAAEPKD